jgi:hypothetical protein
MVKGSIGKAKAAAAFQRRLDRGAAKARRKVVRQSGYWITKDGGKELRPCTIYAEFGRHNNQDDYDRSRYCVGCFRDAPLWFGWSEDYPYYE